MKPNGQPPKRPSSMLRSLWSKHWKWISGIGFVGFLTGGFTMIQVEEYLPATVWWACACVCLFGWLSLHATSIIKKFVGLAVSALVFAALAKWTLLKKDTRPWSAFSVYFIVPDPPPVVPSRPEPPEFAYRRPIPEARAQSEPSASPSEVGRRKALLRKLISEYITTHDTVDRAVLEGKANPPADWVNDKLKHLGETWTISEPELPDADIYVVNPASIAIIVHNRSAAVLKNPRYSVVIWDLDSARKDSLPTFSPAFRDDWLRPGSAFGPWRIFENLQEPKRGDRLLGYATVTCPDCVTERFYWVYTKYGENGWYGELPNGEHPNLRFIISLFDRTVEQQEAAIETVRVRQRLAVRPSF